MGGYVEEMGGYVEGDGWLSLREMDGFVGDGCLC
jgi:hypothetical protein